MEPIIKKITNIKVELLDEHKSESWGDALLIPFESSHWTLETMPDSEELINQIGKDYSLDSGVFNIRNYAFFLEPINKKQGIYEIVIRERIH